MDPEDRSGSDENDPTETHEPDPTDSTGSSSDEPERADTDPTVEESDSAVDESDSTVDGSEPAESVRSSEDHDESVDRDYTGLPGRSDANDPPNGSVSGGTDGSEQFTTETDGSETDANDAGRIGENDVGRISENDAAAVDDNISTRSVAPEDDGVEAGRGDAEATDSDTGDGNERGFFQRFRHDMDGPFMWIREMLSSVAIVLLIGLILFGVSGVWPPMVAVESGSMEPNMEVGDLVFVTEPGRFAPDAADNDIGVVTYEAGQEAEYRSFNEYGSVVIFQPPGRQASPIIHRAMFHVEEGENWYDRADERYHGASDCEELRHCPAPRDGFITLGDDNREYDQANGLAEPVAEEWITGVARLRVPYLGYVRLITTGQAEISDLLGVTTPTKNPGIGVG